MKQNKTKQIPTNQPKTPAQTVVFKLKRQKATGYERVFKILNTFGTEQT